MVGHLERDGARQVMVVVYTAHDPREVQGHPVAPAVRHLRQAGEGFGPMTAWVVASTGYLNLDCVDDCCPSGGRPLGELDGTMAGARMVVAGSVVAGQRSDVAQIRLATAAERHAVARVCARWALRGAQAATAGPVALERWRRGGVEAWRAEVARAAQDPTWTRGPRLGRIEAGLRDLRVRDAVMAALVPGTGDLPERVVRGPQTTPEATAGLARALDTLYRPGGAVAPSSQTPVHVRVLEQVVAHGRADRQAPACTLLALLAWWSGDGARADQLVRRALQANPDYRLAELVAEGVNHGVVPGWARTRQ
jgi:hypothetical protein